MRKAITVALAVTSLALPLAAGAQQCTAASGDRRVPLLELYTSEGCDSCPPTDRWVTQLPVQGYGGDRLVVLAFHVDYWDRLGWIDPFGQQRFSERQGEVNRRNGSRVTYTPQLVFNGRDYRRRAGDDFARRVEDVQRMRPGAAIRLALDVSTGRASASGAWSTAEGGTAQAWLALYENRLASRVAAGENRGKVLEHDFVVRDLAGPFPRESLAHSFALDPKWNRANLGIASFVQDARSGDVLQALAMPLCRPPRS